MLGTLPRVVENLPLPACFAPAARPLLASFPFFFFRFFRLLATPHPPSSAADHGFFLERYKHLCTLLDVVIERYEHIF